jgi:hypothetical protein
LTNIHVCILDVKGESFNELLDGKGVFLFKEAEVVAFLD